MLPLRYRSGAWTVERTDRVCTNGALNHVEETSRALCKGLGLGGKVLKARSRLALRALVDPASIHTRSHNP